MPPREAKSRGGAAPAAKFSARAAVTPRPAFLTPDTRHFEASEPL